MKVCRDHLEELVVQRTKEIEVLNDRLRQSQKMEAVTLRRIDFSRVILGTADLLYRKSAARGHGLAHAHLRQ